MGPQGFWGSGEKGYLFSGSWGALLIILGELGANLDLGSTAKNKKISLSDSLKCRWLLGAIAPRPPYINVISFQFLNISFQKSKYDCIGAFFLGTYRLIIWREALVIFAHKHVS